MMKVLIVEDNPMYMKLVVEILNSLDFMIQTGKNSLMRVLIIMSLNPYMSLILSI
jgi:chemotaxis response regulator CheB